jgi:Tfp pilus assembly protein PilF
VWEGHARLAHCLSGFRDQLKDAQTAADRALFLMPDAPGPHLASGAVALADGRRDDAAAAFCAALAVDPQCGDAHNQLADLQARGRDRGLGGRRLRLSLPSRLRRVRSEGPSSP